MYKVTVITPSYNSAKFIEICIKSIAAQRSDTFKVRHIIMDGGSTDETAEVVKPYLDEDTEFKGHTGGITVFNDYLYRFTKPIFRFSLK